MLRNLTFKKKLYLNIGLIVLAAGVLMGVNYWLMISISKIAVRIQDKRKDLMVQSRFLASETTLRSDLIKAQKEVTYLDNVFPVPEDLIEFPRDISVWAGQSKIEVGFSFIKEVVGQGGEPGYVTFILTGRGSLNNILGFVRMVENSHYFIQFNQYDIIAEEGQYNLLVNGQIFSR